MKKKYEPSVFPKSTIVALSNIEERLFQLVAVMDRIADTNDTLVERIDEIEHHLYEMVHDIDENTGRS